jgi:secondary thiamine-phosphate synthase enzyme
MTELATQLLEIEVRSRGHDSTYDITGAIEARLGALAREAGLLRVCVIASSAALTVMRHEPGTVADLLAVLAELAPRERRWRHEHTTGDANGFAHVRSALLGTSVLVPFAAGRLAMPELHRVVLLDFDPRESLRRVVLDA